MKTTSIKKSQQAHQTAAQIEAVEFAAMFGANVKSTFFENMMKYAGRYLFTFTLILAFIKFAASTYQFIKNKNKNLTQTSSYFFNAIQTGLVATAIIGSLAATVVFAVLTPALFVGSMALDTLRNLGGLLFNTFKLINLRFSLRKQLADQDDHLTHLKYANLKKHYIDNIKEYSLSTVIGAIATTATAIIFLFPHIGLASIGATALTVGAVKVSVAAIAGLGAATAFILPLAKMSFDAIKSKFTRKKAATLTPYTSDTEHISEKSLLKVKQPRSFSITNQVEVEKALQHEIKFNALTQHSQMRASIIEHIDDQEVALEAIKTMLNDKIKMIAAGLMKKPAYGSNFFYTREKPKRLQKIVALLTVKAHIFGQDAITGALEEYQSFLPKLPLKMGQKFKSLDEVISYIETNLKGVHESFFLQESDTQNVLSAVKTYAHKFPQNELMDDVKTLRNVGIA